MLNLFEDSSKDDLREMYSSYIQSKKDGTKQRICFLWKTIPQGNGCRTDNAIVYSN